MIRAASRAKNHLRESVSTVVEFLRSQANADGGFRNRGGASDLYYTMFALEALAALDVPADRRGVSGFLKSYGSGEQLDLIHLACLIRCWAGLSDESIDAALRDGLLKHLESYRSLDGGFTDAVNSETATAYGCFLGLGAYQDLGVSLPDAGKLVESLGRMRREDGSYANDVTSPQGMTPATAAAMVTLHQLGHGDFGPQVEWMIRRARAIGGFTPAERAPMQDLLSTATALFALATVQADYSSVKRSCLEFVDSLWDPQGGFCGTWMDETVDCEYTFYGLLALGNL